MNIFLVHTELPFSRTTLAAALCLLAAVSTPVPGAPMKQYNPGVTPAPLPYDPSAYELAPQFQTAVPWSENDLKDSIRERIVVEKQRRELNVYYYRVGYTVAYPLPLSRRPAAPELPNLLGGRYPWLTWLSWDLEERWRMLHVAWRQFGDREAGALLQRELAALAGWDHFVEGNEPGLVTAHLAAGLSLALGDGSKWDAESLQQARAAAQALIERDLWPWFEKRWSAKNLTPQGLANIPVIALCRGAQLARVIDSPRASALDERARAVLRAWCQYRLGLERHTEGTAYDGYLMDSLTEWLARLPDRDHQLRECRDAFRSLANHWIHLTLPGRADLHAPLGDVEPEMMFWATDLLRFAGWYDWRDAGWLLRHVPLERMRAAALGAALAQKFPTKASVVTPKAGPHEHPNAVSLRTGWDSDDLLAVVGLTRGNMGHLQADGGQVILGWQNRFWIMDPGYQQYLPGEERDYTLGTQAHNAPVIGGIVQTQRAAELQIIETDPRGWQHTKLDLSRCYKSLPRGASVQRDVWLISEGTRAVIVRDTLGLLGQNIEVSNSWHGGTHLAWAFRGGWTRLSDGHRAVWMGTWPGALQAAQLTRHPGSRGPLTLTQTETLPSGSSVRWWIFWCDPPAGWTPPFIEASSRMLTLEAPGKSPISNVGSLVSP